jgi:hypothetical protein
MRRRRNNVYLTVDARPIGGRPTTTHAPWAGWKSRRIPPSLTQELPKPPRDRRSCSETRGNGRGRDRLRTIPAFPSVPPLPDGVKTGGRCILAQLSTPVCGLFVPLLDGNGATCAFDTCAPFHGSRRPGCIAHSRCDGRTPRRTGRRAWLPAPHAGTGPRARLRRFGRNHRVAGYVKIKSTVFRANATGVAFDPTVRTKEPPPTKWRLF